MIKKAVIPAAGLGTRFLPATKVQPKEMLPIVDKPVIQFVVEEAIASGIDDIIIITGRGKRTIEDYFDLSPELESYLLNTSKHQQLDEVRTISTLADIHYIRQKEPRGLGDAILKAEKHVGAVPFAVLLGDDIIRSDVPCIKQLTNLFAKKSNPLIAVENVTQDKIPNYGIIEGERVSNSLYRLNNVIEKPTLQQTRSRLGIVGRYLMTPDLFDCIREVPHRVKDELQLTDAIKILLNKRDVYAHVIEGKRYDAGDKIGYLKAVIDFALERDDLRGELAQYLAEKASVSKDH
ncbi:MAG: UTP--glucose-1-phosphate uridylyltransferase GalU [Halobacteriota archaeon]